MRLERIERRHLPALHELNRERGDAGGDARFAADLAAGYRGYAGFVGDHLAACYWWADASTPRHRDLDDLGLGIELGEHDVYGFDLYVDKRHRAGGTVSDVLFQVETALRDIGAQRIWGYVVARNRPARWIYDARGYRPAWGVARTRRLRRWSSRITPIDAQAAA